MEEQNSEFSVGATAAGPRADAMSRAMLAMTDGLSSASWLIGTWTGSGKGAFPNMGGEEFYYSEEATFVPGLAVCMRFRVLFFLIVRISGLIVGA
jgi:hypothetical protein